MSSEIDPREDKLPVWTRNLLADLRTRVRVLDKQNEEMQAHLENGPEGSNTFVEVDDISRPIGKDVVVQFRLAEGKSFTAEIRKGRLEIESEGGELVVFPRSEYQIRLDSRQ